MRSQARRAIAWPVLVGPILLALAARGSYGQSPYLSDAPRVAQTPQTGIQPRIPTPTTPTAPPAPEAPIPETGAPAAPPEGLPSVPTGPSVGGPSPFAGAFGPEQFAATGGQTIPIAASDGYIDSAITRSRLRLRYDAADDNERPNRAEFFWPQHGPNRVANQPINFQEFSTYLEYAPLPNMSAFIDVPTRFVHIPGARNPNPGATHPGFHPSQNFSGFSDLQLGVKYAFLANPDYFYTFQLRTYLPTGAGGSGLGTDHASLEPGFLAFQRLTERLYFIGEFEDWIPLHGSIDMIQGDPNFGRHFAGNILNYGVGLFYNAVLTGRFRVAPTVEVVGWTVLGGLETVTTIQSLPPTRSAAGDTIIAIMEGLRIGLGNYSLAGGGSPLNDRVNLFVGYSRSVTGDYWYQDMFRLDLTWYY
jgi:hypothetical protein